MAIRKNNDEQGDEAVRQRIRQIAKERGDLKRKLKAPTGGMKDIDMFQLALLAIVLILDVFLGILGIMSGGLIGIVDWVVKVLSYAFIAAVSFAMVFSSSLEVKDYVGIIAFFLLSFAIEVIPLVSILPAMTGFVLRVISAINKAKLKKKIDGLNDEFKRLNQSIQSKGSPKANLQTG